MIVFDERGYKWAVEKGDPAWDICKKVLATGLKEVVIPRCVILSGSTSGVSSEAVAPDPQRPDFLLQCRLWDCLRALDLV